VDALWRIGLLLFEEESGAEAKIGILGVADWQGDCGLLEAEHRGVVTCPS